MDGYGILYYEEDVTALIKHCDAIPTFKSTAV